MEVFEMQLALFRARDHFFRGVNSDGGRASEMQIVCCRASWNVTFNGHRCLQVIDAGMQGRGWMMMPIACIKSV
jgi:hypothetical protein